ncbi:hypothetical protein [Streptomyces spiramenti]|uniref:Integral membrane protein n=1 Tax=Streptomyces spiramenti TaxID=2720606 RepID=A0ABX1AP88_9ACTN|nr:hypothetical protein [Streptomyces spiramenti]NJP68889.1 hypothetical protein [Streptomyces spiramenti]
MSKEPQSVAEGDDAPKPEPIRFYGTTWVDRSGLYPVRRFALGLAAVSLAVVGVVLLRLVYEGLYIANSATWLTTLLVLAFAICSAVAFNRTWASYKRPVPADEHAFRSIKAIGFVGVLLAYGIRSGLEAPGEQLRRSVYEQELSQYRRRTSKRTGNPSRRTAKGGRRRR